MHLTPRLELGILYGLAFGLGLAQAFGIPAGTSILPAALTAPMLEAANGALMGLRQVALLLGPLLAACLVGASRHGLALAFAVDGASFLVSAWTMSRVTLAGAAPGPESAQTVLRGLGAGLAMVWRDVPMRLCFLYWALVALCVGGAMQVALPVLAQAMPRGGALLGWFLGAHGAGTLLGMAAAALGGSRVAFASFGSTILLADALAGLLAAPLGYVHGAWAVAALLLGVGVLSGFLQLTIFTWLQRRVPPAMMGRTMSIFLFIFMGLAPLSAFGAGWLLTWLSVPRLFLAGGAVLVALAAAAWLFTPMRRIARSVELQSG